MAKYNREGTIYIKNLTGIVVPSDGSTKGIFAKAIPPYTVVNRFWVHCWITGLKGLPMHAKQHAVVSGRMSNMPGEINDLASGSTMDTLEELIAAYMPRSPDDPFNGDETDGSHIGLLGDRTNRDLSLWAKEREWFHYETMLGGRNSYITKADAIRFSAEFSKQGRVSGHGCNVDQWRLIAIDANTDGLASDHNTDVEKHVWGDTTANPDVLARQMYQFFGDQGASGLGWAAANTSSEDAYTAELNTPNLQRAGMISETASPDYHTVGTWASTGIGTSGSWNAETTDDTDPGSGLDEDCPLIMQTKVTLELKTIKPSITNIWTPNQ